jgi:hypothetical protein
VPLVAGPMPYSLVVAFQYDVPPTVSVELCSQAQ